MEADLAKEFIEMCHSDEAFFGRTILNSGCWDKQLQIKKALRTHDKIAVQSSHGVGKTYVAADIILEFLYTHHNSTVITTATTAQQVRNILWSEINEKYTNSKKQLDTVCQGSVCLQVELRLGDQWRALGLSPKKDTGQEVATAIQGFHAEDLLVVIDEAGGVEQAIWDSIYGVLTSKNCKLVAIGNPTHVGTEFYRICKNKPVGWKTMTINTLDLPNIKIYGDFDPTKEDCYRLAELWEKDKDKKLPHPRLTTAKWFVDRLYDWGYDNPLFQARALGRFPDKSEDSVFSLEHIEKAMITTKDIGNASICRTLGIDVARFGDDKTVFTVYEDGVVKFVSKYQGKDTVEVSNIGEKIYMDWECEIVGVDDTGVGGGVTDTLRHRGYSVMAFNAGAKATRESEYENLKAEIYFTMAQSFKDGEIDLTAMDKEDADNLTADLLNTKYEITLKGRLKIVSKDKMKKGGMLSPDYAESLMIAYWAYYISIGQRSILRQNINENYMGQGDGGMLGDYEEGF